MRSHACKVVLLLGRLLALVLFQNGDYVMQLHTLAEYTGPLGKMSAQQ